MWYLVFSWALYVYLLLTHNNIIKTEMYNSNNFIIVFRIRFAHNVYYHFKTIANEKMKNITYLNTINTKQLLSIHFISCFSKWHFLSQVFLPSMLRSRHGHDSMVIGFTTTYAISVGHHQRSNLNLGEVYSIQHYVIKFVCDLRQVGGFPRALWFPPPIKLTATK